MFLRRLIDLFTTVSELSHHISLNAEARADILWWHSFLPSRNGFEFIQQTPISSHSLRSLRMLPPVVLELFMVTNGFQYLGRHHFFIII